MVGQLTHKKFGVQKLIKFTYFEGGLLRYLSDILHRRQSDVMRDALHSFAVSHPRFENEAFRKFVEDEILDQIDNPKLRADTQEQVKSFIECRVGDKPPESGLEVTWPDQGMSFDSSAIMGADATE